MKNITFYIRNHPDKNELIAVSDTGITLYQSENFELNSTQFDDICQQVSTYVYEQTDKKNLTLICNFTKTIEFI